MEAVRLRPGIRVSARSILSPELGGRAMAVHQDRGLDELLDNLSREDAKEIVKSLIVDSIRETLGHSDAVMTMVDDLTSETGDTREDLLLKAMILFETALKATRKGQRLVLVESDYRFIQEIVGIDRLKPEAATSGNIATAG
jgi:hypothetical protein